MTRSGVRLTPAGRQDFVGRLLLLQRTCRDGVITRCRSRASPEGARQPGRLTRDPARGPGDGDTWRLTDVFSACCWAACWAAACCCWAFACCCWAARRCHLYKLLYYSCTRSTALYRVALCTEWRFVLVPEKRACRDPRAAVLEAVPEVPGSTQ